MFKILSVVMLCLILLFLGCSHQKYDPTVPSGDILLTLNKELESQHKLWGLWEVRLDLTTFSASLEPMRSSNIHHNITPMLLPPACNNCIFFVINSFNPSSRILDVDVRLCNPTGIPARDVRGILFTNDYGHLLTNPDDWTALWDPAGGEPRNPFKAFAKYKAKRVFSGHTEFTENYLIYIPAPPYWNGITFAVDVSWPGNCKEPYEITNFTQGHINENIGSSAYVTVDVKDWQDDVSKVTLVAPEITGESFTQLSHLSGDTWRTKLVNNTGATQGQYQGRIIANSSNSGDIVLYDYVTINITKSNVPAFPIDVTPPWLNLTPFKVCYDGT